MATREFLSFVHAVKRTVADALGVTPPRRREVLAGRLSPGQLISFLFYAVMLIGPLTSPEVWVIRSRIVIPRSAGIV